MCECVSWLLLLLFGLFLPRERKFLWKSGLNPDCTVEERKRHCRAKDRGRLRERGYRFGSRRSIVSGKIVFC